MSADEIILWLTEGIAAVKAGKRAEARDLLLKVVEADEHNLLGWSWLSEVVTTLEDREVCLENVLALDPDNAEAQQGLAQVRAQMAATPEIEPESALQRVDGGDSLFANVAVDFSAEEFSDPLTCIYCGHLTGETDKRCPKCKRSLQGSFYVHDRPRWLGVAFTVCIAAAFFTAGSLFTVLTIFGGALSIGRPGSQAIDFSQVLVFYLGQTTSLDPQAQRLMLSIFPRDVLYLRLAYILLSLITAFGLLTRKRVFYLLYIANLVVAVVGIVLNSQLGHNLNVTPGTASVLERIFGVVVNELFGVFVTVTGWLAGGLLLLQTVLAFVIERDFDKQTERWWCVIDASARDATGAFVRARSFMKREMWVMAIRYLQRAISLQPNVVDYYLALAESYARLGRYRQSLQILNQAQRLRPDNEMVEKLRGVVLELQARAATTSPPEPMGGL